MKYYYTNILHFWFREIPESKWWKKDPDFDELIRRRYAKVHRAATQGELHPWRQTPEGSLAEILILDQFSRQIYRDQALAFAYDGIALCLAQEMRSKGWDQKLTDSQKLFCYLPFMHSESKVIHQQAIEIFKEYGKSIDFEQRHADIIFKFGRYPHRNQALGRKSTPAEIEFLKTPGSSF